MQCKQGTDVQVQIGKVDQGFIRDRECTKETPVIFGVPDSPIYGRGNGSGQGSREGGFRAYEKDTAARIAPSGRLRPGGRPLVRRERQHRLLLQAAGTWRPEREDGVLAP